MFKVYGILSIRNGLIYINWMA